MYTSEYAWKNSLGVPIHQQRKDGWVASMIDVLRANPTELWISMRSGNAQIIVSRTHGGFEVEEFMPIKTTTIPYNEGEGYPCCCEARTLAISGCQCGGS